MPWPPAPRSAFAPCAKHMAKARFRQKGRGAEISIVSNSTMACATLKCLKIELHVMDFAPSYRSTVSHASFDSLTSLCAHRRTPLGASHLLSPIMNGSFIPFFCHGKSGQTGNNGRTRFTMTTIAVATNCAQQNALSTRF
ncbi:hypothetical protein BC940DRAFT_1101 [Gongronella butleri]|nr:hypothetical protein BC940DRAFT_1101 [Gongronella butleri]